MSNTGDSQLIRVSLLTDPAPCNVCHQPAEYEIRLRFSPMIQVIVLCESCRQDLHDQLAHAGGES